MAQNSRRCRKRAQAGSTWSYHRNNPLSHRIKGESKEAKKRELKANRRRILLGDIRYSHYS